MGEKIKQIRPKPELYPRGELSPGITLSSSKLLTLLLASRGNNPQWRPGQKIQISRYEAYSLPSGWREMVTEGYEIRNEKGNIILSPSSPLDEEFRQLIELCSLAGLEPLIKLIGKNPLAIDFLTLLPNTSLGIKNHYGFFPIKINGISINFNNKAKKQEIQESLDSLRFPWGRSVLVGVLRGIQVEEFISNFSDGSNITSPLRSSTKFLDLLYGEDGVVYVVIGGGGLEKGTSLVISGTNNDVRKMLNTIYTNARAELLKRLKVLTKDIGGGVRFEEVTAYPYVGYDLERNIVFSGSPGDCSNGVLFNPHPHFRLSYCLHKDPLIGVNPKNPVTKIVNPKVSGTPLTRVADFGLKVTL